MSRRRAILEQRGMHLASPDAQRVFWGEFNWGESNRRRRAFIRIGDLAAGLVTDRTLETARELDRLRSAWYAVIPERFQTLSDVESLRSGCLTVQVDNKSAMYVLDRKLGLSLLSMLNQQEPGSRIDRIRFRLRSARDRARMSRLASIEKDRPS